MMEEIWNVTWSNTVKIVTVCCIVLFVGGVFYSFFFSSARIEMITFVFGVLILVFAFLYPKKIELDENSLVVHFNLRKKKIDINNIEEIHIFENNKYSYRILGSSALFGYLGYFYNSKIGMYKAFIGDPKDSFILILKKNKKRKKIALSCQDYKSLLAELAKRNISTFYEN